jgi:hypothetical protein
VEELAAAVAVTMMMIPLETVVGNGAQLISSLRGQRRGMIPLKRLPLLMMAIFPSKAGASLDGEIYLQTHQTLQYRNGIRAHDAPF